HERYGEALANFTGDTSPFEAAAPELTRCLRAEHRPMPELPRMRLPELPVPRLRMPRVSLPRVTVWWKPIAALLVVAIIVAVLVFRDARRWRAFVARLRSEPGILVTGAERRWLRSSRVSGLLDPAAKDPASIARELKLNPERIRFAWREYTADDPAILQRRLGLRPVKPQPRGAPADAARALAEFRDKFPLPPTVTAVVASDTLVLSGTAPYEWIGRVQEGATDIAGIAAINGDNLVVEFDPDRVLQRFREQFGVPQGVQASLRNGRLVLTGEAPHEWLDRVRRGAMRVPGVHMLDDRRVQDIDQRTFHAAKAAIEEAAVLFVLNRDSLPPDAAPVLTSVAEQARRCLEAATNMGVNVQLELRAYGDAVASEEENAALSRKRADVVRAFLASNGVAAEKLNGVALGTPAPPEPGEKPGAGKFDRRVFFRVSIQP
ncbi:MAG TPA: OmpA family protein, partial [Chthoniobacterales bacterium]